jgi:hypothetical protein
MVNMIALSAEDFSAYCMQLTLSTLHVIKDGGAPHLGFRRLRSRLPLRYLPGRDGRFSYIYVPPLSHFLINFIQQIKFDLRPFAYSLIL